MLPGPQVEDVAGKRVVIDGPASRTYRYELDWDPAKPDAFRRVLKESLGLELKPERRAVDFLCRHRATVVREIKTPANSTPAERTRKPCLAIVTRSTRPNSRRNAAA